MRALSTKSFIPATRKQGGFSLITVFIAVALLLSAVMYFSFGRAVSTHDTVNQVSKGHAQTILSYAASIQAGVDHLIYKGENSASITLDRIYDPAQGGVRKQKIATSPYAIASYAPWSYRVAGIRVAGIGTGYSDYIATGGVGNALCTNFNALVGVSGVPTTTDASLITATNPGTTTTGGVDSTQLDFSSITAIRGKRQFCLNLSSPPNSGWVIFQIVVPR